MRIDIPEIKNNIAGYSAIGKIARETNSLVFDELVLDFSNCPFFEANMAAPLDVVLTSIRDDFNDVKLASAMKPQLKNILQKNHFLEYWNIPSIPDSNATTLPFKRFKLGESILFYEYLNTFMTGHGLPQMSSELRKKFLESLLEVFQNATEHSESLHGIFVCGQFFPQKGKMDFTVADAGVGARQRVREFMKNDKISSVQALKWTLEEGNTTRNSLGGLGLKLLKDFIKLNAGKLQIISRYAYYEYAGDKDNFQKMQYDFPGTCVTLEINTEDPKSYYLKKEKN